VSDKTTKEKYPLSLNLLHILCPITPQKKQQLNLSVLYAQHEKEIVSGGNTK
jgi:hypothetical protein